MMVNKTFNALLSPFSRCQGQVLWPAADEINNNSKNGPMTLPNPLRSITIRLNATPVEDLPRYAGFLASSILSCAETIRTAEAQKGEVSVLLHKLKTRVSSLIQDKTSEGRFTGIVLVKAIVDAGGPQTLTTSGIWARNLLSCLNKHDPPEVKKLCLVTITRIFLLTKDYPALVREITTPALPSFITTSLGLIKPLVVIKGTPDKQISSPLLQPVLECWLQLLHHFPSTFRPLLPQIRTIGLNLISDETTHEIIRSSAANVLAALHFSAPKNTASLNWSQTCQQIIEATHRTADCVFRSILEEWTSINSRPSESVNGKVTSVVENKDSDALGMAPWSGMQAGCSRIVHLLELLTASLVSEQAQPVGVPLAEVVDLAARLAAVVPPSTQFSLRQNQEISRDEREELWIQLPRLHTATVELLNGLGHAYQHTIKPLMPIISSQIWDIFEANTAASGVKAATYRALNTFLEESGTELTTADSGNLATLVEICCSDLRSGTMKSASQSLPTMQDKSTKSTSLALNSQNGSVFPAIQAYPQQSNTYQAAWDLLPQLFAHVTPLLTASVRADLDRTAILLGHQKAMLASVLNPPVVRKGVRVAPSILPFLARADSGNLSFEALVRPRMPVIVDSGGLKDTLPDEEIQESELPFDQVDVQMQQEMASVLAQQAEEHASEQPAADVEATKKRDFARVDPDVNSAALQASEITKRPRTEDNFQNQIPAEGWDASDFRAEPDTFGQEVGILPEYESKTMTTASTGPSTISITRSSEKVIQRSESSNIASKSNRDGDDDDSDDDAIPTIDATLTSDSEDEDEDEDEDEEMEES